MSGSSLRPVKTQMHLQVPLRLLFCRVKKRHFHYVYVEFICINVIKPILIYLQKELNQPLYICSSTSVTY